MSNGCVLALYDFASKQDFIYRTSKIKEISGASELLAGMYRELVGVVNAKKVDDRTLLYFDESMKGLASFSMEGFSSNDEIIGQVVYDGGGNLMVLYRSKTYYVEANKIMSAYLLENIPGLQMICSYTELTCDEAGDPIFSKTTAQLYLAHGRRKNLFPSTIPWEVTPMTQIDPQTFLPVTKKISGDDEQLSLSADRALKRLRYQQTHQNDASPDEFSSLAAVVYIDGNALGARVKACMQKTSFDKGVADLRELSNNINRVYLEKPEQLLRAHLQTGANHLSFRKILGAGDEITFICDASIALQLVSLYFRALEEANRNIEEDKRFYSCAGIAVAHAKTPFHKVYALAEAACESAKTLSRGKNGNYFDFYYCHVGVTNDFETFRKREQSMTARPYSVADFHGIIDSLVPKLLAAGRSNVKALVEAAQASITNYRFEVRRINAYITEKCASYAKNPNGQLNLYALTGLDKAAFRSDETEKAAAALAQALCFLDGEDADMEAQMKQIYDLSEFFDLWFATEQQYLDLKGVFK